MLLNKPRALTILLGLIVLLFAVSLSYAMSPKEQMKATASEYLQTKSKFTGTLDIYDQKINQVRNLKLISWNDGDEENQSMTGVFRDRQTGDVIEIVFQFEDDGASVKEVKLKGIKEKTAKKEVDINKEFTDDEVRAAMKDYVEQKSRFSQTFGFYDEKASKMRNLELVDISEEVRQFGILNIATAYFTDVDSKEKVDVDITFEKKEGELRLKTLRLKKVHPAE